MILRWFYHLDFAVLRFTVICFLARHLRGRVGSVRELIASPHLYLTAGSAAPKHGTRSMYIPKIPLCCSPGPGIEHPSH